MRTTRFMTWCFLSLSLALMCVRSFRPALEAPLASLLPDDWTGEFGAAASARNYEWMSETKLQVRLLYLGTGPLLERLFTLRRYVTPEGLLQMAREAERSGNSDFMAFAALHLLAPSMCDDVLRLTDRAVTVNPKLTWLIYFTTNRCALEKEARLHIKDWQAQSEKLQAWDPDNTTAYLARAHLIRFGEGWKWPGPATDTSKIQDVLTQHLEWQKVMEEAISRPRFASYHHRRLELERSVMLAHGWNNPLAVVYTLGGPIPYLFDLRDYATHVATKMGEEAEAEGRFEDSLRQYRTMARFGERMRLQDTALIERLVGISIQKAAYEHLLLPLKKAGKTVQVAAVEYAQKQMLSDLDQMAKGQVPHTSSRTWSVLLADITATAVWVFLFLSVVSIGYVNAKLWIRRDKKARLYHVMTVLENYAPLMLFISCLALGIIYAPYAQNFSTYMTGSEPQNNWPEFLANSFPTPRGLWRGDLPVQNPYPGFVAYTLVIAGLILAVAIVRTRLEGRKKSLLH